MHMYVCVSRMLILPVQPSVAAELLPDLTVHVFMSSLHSPCMYCGYDHAPAVLPNRKHRPVLLL